MSLLLDRFIYPLRGTSARVPGLKHLYGTGEPCRYFAGPPDASRVILFVHGNRTSLADVDEFAIPLQTNARCAVVAITYRGYPGTELLGDGAGGARYGYGYDRETAMRVACIARELNSKFQDVTVLGHSLGCAAALASLEHYQPQNLVLLAPFSDLRTAAEHGWGRWTRYVVPQARLNNLSAASHARCNVLLLHGSEDAIIPPAQSNRLYLACSNAARRSRVLLNGFDHALTAELGNVVGRQVHTFSPPPPARRGATPQLQFRA